MSLPVIALLTIQGIGVLLLVVLIVQAFRTHAGWGSLALLPLGPFLCGLLHIHTAAAGLVAIPGLVGLAAFAIKHQKRAGVLFLLYVGCAAASLALLATSPAVIAYYARINPRFAAMIKTVNPSAYDEAQKLSPSGDGSSGDSSPGAKPTPHETRDLAENETPYPTATPDPNAALRTAYFKHAKDLTAAYQQLDAERRKLKPKSPAVAAFNTKAARYQQDLQTLAAEKTRLDALDRASNINAEAAAALVSLRTAAAAGDYETVAATLKKSLSDYRQTPAFPGIVALARPVLAGAAPDKVLTGLQGKAAAAARGEFDKTTRKVQAIVNQTPPIVPKPADDAEVYHYSYHPGANAPDYDAENLLATREIWKGEYAYIEGVPNVYYRSAECEFNPQTKYFYTSRTVPKKKLSDAEYGELTRLFHLLGQQQKAMANVPPPTADAERVFADLAALKAQLDGDAPK